MLTTEQKQQFHRDGYLLVPGVLTKEEVASLRKLVRPIFDLPADQRHPGDTPSVVFDVYSRYPEVRWLLFHEPTLNILRSLLGNDFVVLREAAVHLNQFFPKWHKDTTSQEEVGHTFHWQDDFLMVEIAFYLQDNSEEYGGGLDVEPGSHVEPDKRLHWPRRTRLQRVLDRVTGKNRVVEDRPFSIPSRAGDLLIFHFRTNHRATLPLQNPVPSDHEKLVFFLACSSNSPHVKAYHDFLASRPNYIYLQDFRYPPDLLEQAKKAGVTLV